ncbi:MAG: hypothetical protein AAFW00_23625 [Bacteroidota bacterium]
MSKRKDWKPLLLLWGGVAAILFLIFGEMLFHLGSYFFGYAGDGLTPYYVSSYQLQFGEGASYQGMHYPYGQPLPLVAFPLLIWILQGVQFFVDLVPCIPGILNYSMILSYFITAHVLYLLFRKSLLPPYLAVLFALLTTFLSPQVARLTGHYSLTYSFFIPLMWYYLILYIEYDFSLKYLGLYVFIAILGTFLHPYYAYFAIFFIGAMWFIHSIQARTFDWIRGVLALGSSLIPGLLLVLYMAVSWDGNTDYIDTPYGLGVYVAGFEGIFLPRLEPYWTWWNQVLGIRELTFEGYAYVGLPGLLLLFFWLGRIGRLLAQKKGRRIVLPVLPDTLRTSIWAVVILLPVAMAYPIQWNHDWAELVGPLKHFRSTGRLAWWFYYVYMVLSGWALYAVFRWTRRKYRTSWIGISVIALATVSWGTYAYLQWGEVVDRVEQQPTNLYPEYTFEWGDWMEEKGEKLSHYQALIGLPYTHFGTGKFNLENWEVDRFCLAASANTGLPMINNRSAKASLTDSWKAIQWVSHPTIARQNLEDIGEEAILLVVLPGAVLSTGEQFLVDQAQPLDGTDFAQMYKLEISKLRDGLASQQPGSLPIQEGVSGTEEGGFVYKLEEGVWVENETYTLFEGPLSQSDSVENWEVSFWMRLGTEGKVLPKVQVEVVSESGNQQTYTYYSMRSKDVWQGNVRFSQKIELKNPADVVNIRLKARQLFVHHVLLRREGVTVWMKNDTVRSMNNYFLE